MRLNSAVSSLNRGRLSASIIQPGGEDSTKCQVVTAFVIFMNSAMQLHKFTDGHTDRRTDS